MSASEYRFEIEHVFADSLWNNDTTKAFLEANGYTRQMAGNKIGLYSDPQLVAQLQKLLPSSPLRQALLDEANGRGLNRHDGGAPTGNQLGKNLFLRDEINEIINSGTSPSAKKAALDNLHEWTSRLARGEILGSDGKPMSIMGNTDVSQAYSTAYRTGPQAGWVNPTEFDNAGSNAAAEARARAADHYNDLAKTNISNTAMRRKLVEGSLGALESKRLITSAERALAEAELRKKTAAGVNSANDIISHAVAERTGVWNGTEVHTRVDANGVPERVRLPVGEAPPGTGWVSEADARSGGSSIWTKAQERQENIRNRIRTVEADPANRLPDGHLTNGASGKIKALERAGRVLGAAGFVWDLIETDRRIRQYEAQGRGDLAAAEAGGFLGRQGLGWAGGIAGFARGAAFGEAIAPWLSAFLSRAVGASRGASLGALAGPVGAIVGGIVGAIFFSAVGDRLGRMFGPYLLRRDPLILDLDGGGAHLTALRAPAVYFDLDSDGFREQTGWVQAGEALLARDLDGNGLIDNGGELFGTATRDGFSILRDYDANADGVINAADAVWSTLLLWRDLDQDGLTDAGELSTPASRGVISISLAATASNEVRDGNSEVAASFILCMNTSYVANDDEGSRMAA